MLDNTIVSGIVKKIGFSGEGLRIEKLQGDASNRSYYRLILADGKTLIIMKLADPLGIKQAEEKFFGSASAITELPFINILSFLEARSVPVPKLYFYEKDLGLLFLEDVGEQTLEDYIRSGRDYTGFYREALVHLVNMQHAEDSPNARCIAFTRKFEDKLFAWEFDHYIEYGMEYLLDLKLPENEKRDMREVFARLSKEICAQPFCFTHRDYHSRNLMVKDGRLGIIDFQDALMGPVSYDLASLLRDSYTELSEDFTDELLAWYFSNAGSLVAQTTEQQFRRYFDITAMQRNLKAAGRFAYIKAVKNNDLYCGYIPSTLKKVARTLKKYDDLAGLHALLGKYVTDVTQ